MITVCDLANDLRDAVVEYQVSTDIEKRAGRFTHEICRSPSRKQSTSRTVD